MALAEKLIFLLIIAFEIHFSFGLNFTFEELEMLNDRCHRSSCEPGNFSCNEAKSYEQIRMSEPSSDYDCVAVPSWNQSIYMRGTCMEAWTDPVMFDLCTQDSKELIHDIFVENHVFSTLTNITYKNYFCAVCNNESVSDIRFWTTKMTCYFSSENELKEYVQVDKQFFLDNIARNDDETFSLDISNNKSEYSDVRKCVILREIPDLLRNKVRLCQISISNCSSNWTNRYFENMCKAYINFVYSKNEQYNNYHCALCNYVDIRSIQCNPLPKGRNILSKYTLSLNYEPQFPEFKCPDGQKWKVNLKKCSPGHCPGIDLRSRDGSCLTTSVDIDANNLTCKIKTLIKKNRFHQLHNSSDIIINKTGQIYTTNEYVFHENGILVCTAKSVTIMGWLTFVGLSLSSICLAIHILATILIPELRNLSGLNLTCLCLCLLVAYFCFIINPYIVYGCSVLAYAMYYFFLAAFAWMNVISFDIWLTLKMKLINIQEGSERYCEKFFFYSLYAWTLPGISLIVILAIDFKNLVSQNYLPELDKDSREFCWFGQKNTILIYMVAPLAATMFLNVIFFALSINNLVRNDALKNMHEIYKVYMKLAGLMVFSWIIGIFAAFFQNEYVWFVFIIINSFQGLYILSAYTCTKELRCKFQMETHMHDYIFERECTPRNKSSSTFEFSQTQISEM